MTDDDPTQEDATVWAATWIPNRSPFDGFGADGFAVAWVDLIGGRRRQVLVAGGEAPTPGTRGTVDRRRIETPDGGTDAPVFVPAPGGAA